MPALLIVEDDLNIRELIGYRFSDYDVSSAANLAEAEKILNSKKIDLILLDVELPDGNGFQFCSQLRKDSKYTSLPILFLTGKGETADKVTGFSIGADDYISKPFDPLELRARIEARLRQHQKSKLDERYFQIRNLKLDMLAGFAYIENRTESQKLDLTPLEFKILFFFSQHFQEIVSREKLIENIWKDNLEISDRTIDSHMSNLRRKLRHADLTFTAVYGEGYIMEAKQ